jgi:ABC-type branched-subunit amino acid transport system ATPase component
MEEDHMSSSTSLSCTPLLQVSHLHKFFGGNRAVDGVSFSLMPGEVLALIGPNGAGKSTTFNLLNGQLTPDSGEVLLEGQDITGASAAALARRGVGRTFQTAQTFASFTVLENVQIALMAAAGLSLRLWSSARRHQRDEAMQLLDQVGLQAQAQRPCTALAYADLKRLELALALATAIQHGQPKLLLMDEPTAGMAAADRLALMDLVRRLVQDKQLAVLLTEHSMDVVFGYADRVLVMVRGRVLAEGSPDEMQRNAEVQAHYLGHNSHTTHTRAAWSGSLTP